MLCSDDHYLSTILTYRSYLYLLTITACRLSLSNLLLLCLYCPYLLPITPWQNTISSMWIEFLFDYRRQTEEKHWCLTTDISSARFFIFFTLFSPLDLTRRNLNLALKKWLLFSTFEAISRQYEVDIDKTFKKYRRYDNDNNQNIGFVS